MGAQRLAGRVHDAAGRQGRRPARVGQLHAGVPAGQRCVRAFRRGLAECHDALGAARDLDAPAVGRDRIREQPAAGAEHHHAGGCAADTEPRAVDIERRVGVRVRQLEDDGLPRGERRAGRAGPDAPARGQRCTEAGELVGSGGARARDDHRCGVADGRGRHAGRADHGALLRADGVALADDEARRDRAAALCLDRGQRRRRHAPGACRVLDRRVPSRRDAQVGRHPREEPDRDRRVDEVVVGLAGRRRPDAGLHPSGVLLQPLGERAEQRGRLALAAQRRERRRAGRPRQEHLRRLERRGHGGRLREQLRHVLGLVLLGDDRGARAREGQRFALADLDLVVGDLRPGRGDRRLRDEVELVQRLDHLGLRHLAVVHVLGRAPDADREAAERAGGGRRAPTSG